MPQTSPDIILETENGPNPLLERRDRIESQAMVVGLAALAFGLVIVAIHTLLQPAPPTQADLRQAIASSEFDRAICPNGWAAAHAEFLDLTEAEISAWYVAESFRASDDEIISDAKAFFENPRDYRWVEGMALTVTQIKLCVAESRRLL